jgi:hypothetical protein
MVGSMAAARFALEICQVIEYSAIADATRSIVFISLRS